MYREVLSVAKSLYRLSLTDPFIHLFWIVGRLSGPMTMMISDTFGTLCSRVRRLDSDLTVGVLMWAAATKAYLDARRRGLDISAFRYEDLVARPLDMCRVILEFCHLPVSLAELAVKAFDRDSHRNAISAASVLRRFKEPQLTPEKKTRLDELLKNFGFPPIGEQSIVEGTFSCLD